MSWNILHLAAIENDQALWPEVFPMEKLESIQRQMGTALFSCMFLGRPEALTGDIFNPRWFRSAQLVTVQGEDQMMRNVPKLVLRYTGLDGQPREKDFSKLVIYQFWDLAISAKETADFTCCVTIAVDSDEMDLFILDCQRGHWSFEVTQQKIVEFARLWNPSAIGIESIAYQAAAVQVALASSFLPVRDVKVDRDKVVRSRLPAARAEAGKLYILHGMPWVGPLLDELAAFPTGAHDDQVDALSGAAALAAGFTPSRFELFGEG